jgi:hypothetical protein
MAYLGRQPIIGNYQVLDAITASATATYALTKNSVAVFPQTPANCIVSLNGVIQAPTDSYTISGSNIVFASALTGSDSIDFITVLGDVLNVGTVSDGTIGLAKLSATGTKDATTFLRGDNTFQTIGTNTPAFAAKNIGTQSITNDADNKLVFDTVVWDTDSAYSTVNNRFTVPTGKGGKYFFHAHAQVPGIDDGEIGQLLFLINGGADALTNVRENFSGTDQIFRMSMVYTVSLSAGDYVEVSFYQNSGGSQNGTNLYFSGYRLIGV